MARRNSSLRVGIPKKYVDVVDWLCPSSDSSDDTGESELFRSRAHAVTFAAAYGHHLGGPTDQDVKLPKKGDIRPGPFQTDDMNHFIDVLALAVEQDVAILSDDNEETRREIFVEHMACGLRSLANIKGRSVPNPLEELRDLIESVGGSAESTQDELRRGIVLPP